MDMNFFRTSKIKKVATTWVFTTFLGNTIMTTKPRYNRNYSSSQRSMHTKQCFHLFC
jgi:hypothetical protein